jgi:ABC-2 type transport system permease protein
VVPPFAPLLMPLRVATGSASVLEIALAAVLLVLAVVLMLRLAGRIYAHTLLHRGARLRWRQALRSAASDRPG